MLKKYIIITVMTAAVITGSILTGAIDVNSENVKGTADMFCWWKFDEESGNAAKDSSKNGIDGEIIGNAVWKKGKTGGAIYLNGKTCVANKKLKEEEWPEFTVAVWVKAESLENITKQGIFYNNKKISTFPSFQIDIFPSKGSKIYRYLGGTGEEKFKITMGELTLEWVHLAVTYDGNTTKLYYNGEQTGSSKGGANEFSQIVVGVTRKFNNYFKGLIDDLRVYKKALNPEEIKNLASGE